MLGWVESKHGQREKRGSINNEQTDGIKQKYQTIMRFIKQVHSYI